MADKKIMGSFLKHPVLKNLEYFDLSKQGETVCTVDPKEGEGLTWREMQLLCGKKIGLGSFRYALKFKGNDQIEHGQFRTVMKSVDKKYVNPDPATDSKIADLTTKIDALVNTARAPGSVDNSLLIEIMREGHRNTLQTYVDRIAEKDKTIDKLNKDCEDCEQELGKLDAIIDDLKSQSGLNQYIQIAQDFLKSKVGKAKPLADVSMSDQSDIPPRILAVLGVVDWSAIDESVLSEIIKYLEIFIQKLPLKERS
jgi:hypothetical protein